MILLEFPRPFNGCAADSSVIPDDFERVQVAVELAAADIVRLRRLERINPFADEPVCLLPLRYAELRAAVLSPSLGTGVKVSKPPKTQVADVARLVERIRPLFAPGQVIELRRLGCKAATASRTLWQVGLTPTTSKIWSWLAQQVTDRAKGVYCTLNALNPDILARRCNRIDRAEEGELSKDRDIIARRWLPIDFDPVRDSRISASDEEKAFAKSAVDDVRDFLGGRGWPAPVLLDSGNGFWLMYRIDLPTDDGGVVERCLKELAPRFDSDKVKIDTGVFNPARICKMTGTMARKGDNIPNRPHRRADVLELARPGGSPP